jgi:hypothetical protein
MRFYLIFMLLSFFACENNLFDQIAPSSDQVDSSSDQTEIGRKTSDDLSNQIEKPSNGSQPKDPVSESNSLELPSSELNVPLPLDALCSWNVSSEAGSDETTHSPPAFIEKTFYVSTQDGNDDRDEEAAQDPSTPWKTLNKIKEKLVEWDEFERKKVAILFKRGETFSGGDLGFNANQQNKPDELLYFGAYGEGPKPVLSGAASLQDSSECHLEVHNGNSVYRCRFTSFVPSQLWIDGRLQPAARWPREDWAIIDSAVINNTQIDVTSLTPLPDSNLLGAMFRYKMNLSDFNHFEVSGRLDQVLSGSAPANSLPSGQYGYYLDQHPILVQEPLDWAFDSQSNDLYFYPPEDENFDLSRVTVTKFKTGFRPAGFEIFFGLFFEDLVFSHYTEGAINLFLTFEIDEEEDHVVKVNNCEFRDLLKAGVFLLGGNGESGVTNSTFENLYTGGAITTTLFVSSSLKIQNNRFSKVGLLPGYRILDLSFQESLQALVLNGTKNTLVKGNVFEEIGGRVISADRAENLIIEDNHFSDTQKHVYLS